MEDILKKIEAISSVDSASLAEKASLYRELGDAQNELGEWEQAQESFEQAAQQFKDAEVDDPRLKALIHQGASLSKANQGNFDEAMEESDRAEAIFTATDDALGLTQTLRRKATIYVNQGEMETCLATLTTAMSQAQNAQLDLEIGKCHSTFGDLFFLQKKYQESVKSYQEGLKVFEKVDDKRMMAEAYIRIGEILILHDRHDQGMSSLIKAADCYADADLVDKEGAMLTNIAKRYEGVNKVSEAINNYELAAEAYGKSCNLVLQGDCLYQIGFLYEQEVKDGENAARYYSKALPIAQESGDEMLIDTITDSYEELQEKLEAGKITQKPVTPKEKAKADQKKSGGLFGRLKDIFGA